MTGKVQVSIGDSNAHIYFLDENRVVRGAGILLEETKQFGFVVKIPQQLEEFRVHAFGRVGLKVCPKEIKIVED